MNSPNQSEKRNNQHEGRKYLEILALDVQSDDHTEYTHQQNSKVLDQWRHVASTFIGKSGRG